MVLLRLDDVASQHLWVLDLNLRIVEDVIVIVDVLYYFDRASVLMLPVFLLGFRGALAALMGSVHLIYVWLLRVVIALVVKVVAALVTVVATQLVVTITTIVLTISRTTIGCTLSLHFMRRPFFLLLINNLFLVTIFVIYVDLSNVLFRLLV